jgi:hypothetical protein
MNHYFILKAPLCRNRLIATLIISFVLIINFHSQAQDSKVNFLPTAKSKQTKVPYSKMALTAKYVGVAIADTNWFNWCVSPIEGQDGKVHIFGSRWPAKDGMEGWTGPNAEIAHFVSDRPEGPFKYVATIMKSSMFPDPRTMWGPHNPRLEHVDGKYILLYICQNPSKETRQRIGMMIADKLDGPWKFAGDKGGIIIQNSTDPHHWTYNGAIGADNPAFMKIGKKYYVYFKSGTPGMMEAKYGYAVSDHLEGPYTLSDHPITDNVSYLEDAQAFKWRDKYFLLTTDNLGGNTGVYGDIILWTSKTGLDFKLADSKIAMGNILDYWGTEADHKKLLATPGLFIRDGSGKLERPAILLLKGKPAYFYSTADVNVNGGKVSQSYIFKINWPTDKNEEY